jgi:glycosyltransferase involved in cell wall biosynthesis
MSLRIAIDARLNAYRQGGIPQYTRQLLSALAEIAPNDQFVSLQHRRQPRPLSDRPNVVQHTLWTPPHHRLEQWTLPLELLAVRPQVLHCPDFIAPQRRFCPAVVTIHDLAFLRFPEILTDDARAYYGQVQRSTASADGIIAVSEATRRDICELLDIPPERVHVIYEAADPVYRRVETRAGEQRKLGGVQITADGFLLFVSTIEPRKNVPMLLKALRIAIDRQPERRYKLVIVGSRGWRDTPIYATVRELHLEEHLIFTGAISIYDLRWLYSACRLYVNPSLYEGFGLPLLEAMACGAACLAADTSSLPEVGGDAARYLPPREPEAWANAIEQLWDDEPAQRELGQRGLARALRFSWPDAASATLNLYRQAINTRAAQVGARG